MCIAAIIREQPHLAFARFQSCFWIQWCRALEPQWLRHHEVFQVDDEEWILESWMSENGRMEDRSRKRRSRRRRSRKGRYRSRNLRRWKLQAASFQRFIEWHTRISISAGRAGNSSTHFRASEKFFVASRARLRGTSVEDRGCASKSLGTRSSVDDEGLSSHYCSGDTRRQFWCEKASMDCSMPSAC